MPVENDELYIKRKKRNKILLLVFYTFLFALATASQSMLDELCENYIGSDYVVIHSIQGIINVFMILMTVFMVTTSKTGYYLAVMATVVDTAILLIRVCINKDVTILPGVSIMILGLFIDQVIHNYLVKLEKNEKELFDLAHTDVLTDLPNRRAMKQRMSAMLEDARLHNHKFAICMVDLDNFKNVNDTIGHDYGDKVLLGIANRWRELMNDNDFMARLGGDEFALLVSDFDSLGTLDEHLNELMKAVGEKFILKGRDYYISASMGVALFPSDSLDSSQLLKYADMAMYAAKYQGKKRICYFDSMMDDMMENSVQMENVIRHAIETDAFKLVYQPQYQAKDKKLRGFEALIRLCDTKGKEVSPAAFIPVAEKSSLIIDIDRWVMRNAMMEFRSLLRMNPDIILSINISAIHMLDSSFLSDLDQIITEIGYPTENLELELTESVFVDSIDKAKTIMTEIKKRGIRIALDDFGTGYSSLSYLKELPIDMLKIDKAFVDSIKDGPKEESFVAAIISLSRLMQFAVISEGVEEEYQLSTLKNMGCDYIQGFLWGRPQVLGDIAEIVKKS